MFKQRIVRTVQRSIARSRTGARIAIALRNQCNSVIGLRCKSSIDHEKNGEAWLVERVAPTARVVVDVGANLGNWTALFSRNMTQPGRAVLFEPNPEAVTHLLKRSWAREDLNVEIRSAAAADRKGTLVFFAEASSGETSSLVQTHSNRQATAIEVPVVTLDDELSAMQIDRIDMLKIDAEGYDLRVLHGAREMIQSQRIRVIQFEYNAPWAAAGSTLAGAYQLLEGAGYMVFLLKAEGLRRIDPQKLGEFFRFSNFVALHPDESERVLCGETPADLF